MSNNERSLDNPAWRAIIISDVENEGFEYAFIGYDDYAWVDDPKFQELLNGFLESRRQLQAYVGISEDN